MPGLRLVAIGSIEGGPTDDQGLFAAVDQAWRLLEPVTQSSTNSVRLAVLFEIPGSIFRPTYEGIRLGRWLASEALYEVRVALPSKAGGVPSDVVWEALTKAVDRVERALRKVDARFTVDEARRAIETARTQAALEGQGHGLQIGQRSRGASDLGQGHTASEQSPIIHVLYGLPADVVAFDKRIARDGFEVVDVEGAPESHEGRWFGVVARSQALSMELQTQFLEELAPMYSITYDGWESATKDV